MFSDGCNVRLVFQSQLFANDILTFTVISLRRELCVAASCDAINEVGNPLSLRAWRGQLRMPCVLVTIHVQQLLASPASCMHSPLDYGTANARYHSVPATNKDVFKRVCSGLCLMQFHLILV